MNDELKGFDDIETAINIIRNTGNSVVSDADIEWAISILKDAFNNGYSVVKKF